MSIVLGILINFIFYFAMSKGSFCQIKFNNVLGEFGLLYINNCVQNEVPELLKAFIF